MLVNEQLKIKTCYHLYTFIRNHQPEQINSYVTNLRFIPIIIWSVQCESKKSPLRFRGNFS